ncbi:MAG: hypothetical protein ACFFBD_23505, partial [Candidatus Hodarchaeota archaeon]
LTQEEIKKWQIDDKYLVPVLSRANYATPPVFTMKDFAKLVQEGKKAYLLNITELEPQGTIQNYLRYGKSNKVDQRYLTRHRTRWFFVEKRTPAPLLCKVFSRGVVQFILNETDCLYLTSFHGIYPHHTDSRILKGLVLFLNSKMGNEMVKSHLRIYGGRLKKMEPRDVESILVPNFSLCANEELNRLEALFENWRQTENKLSQADQQIEEYLSQIIEQIARNKT